MQAYIVYFPTVLFSVFFIFDVHTNYLQLYFVSGSHSTPRSTPAEINTISQHSTLLILTYCAHWIVRLLTVVFFLSFPHTVRRTLRANLGSCYQATTSSSAQIAVFLSHANHDYNSNRTANQLFFSFVQTTTIKNTNYCKSVYFLFCDKTSLIVSAHFPGLRVPPSSPT